MLQMKMSFSLKLPGQVFFSPDSCKSNLCDIMQQGANVKNTEGGSFSHFGDDLFLGESRFFKVFQLNG